MLSLSLHEQAVAWANLVDFRDVHCVLLGHWYSRVLGELRRLADQPFVLSFRHAIGAAR